MTQGNPYGRGSAPWPTETKLRAWARSGRTLDEIAELVEEDTSWRPARSVVSRKLQEIGEPARRASHRDFMPRGVRVDHNGALLRRMLEAEHRAQMQQELSSTDRKLTSLLHRLLFERGTQLVIGYDRHIGWYLRPREDADGPYLAQQPAARYKDPVEQAIWEFDELPEEERGELVSAVRARRTSMRRKTA